MVLLYTTKEIAEMYGGEQKNVTPYMITHTWVPNGLRYIKGKGNSFLFKKEWIEQYLESISENRATNKKIIEIKQGSKKIIKNNCFVH